MTERIFIRSASSTFFAEIERESEEILLLRLDEGEGDLPEAGHLLGEFFPDEGALVRALLAACKDVGDTLDNVLLSKKAYAQWMRVAEELGQRAQQLQIPIEEIPDEQAKALPDGTLKIWIDIPKLGRASTIIAKQDWSWRVLPN